MIEAGDIRHYSLLIRPESTNDIYSTAQREKGGGKRERGGGGMKRDAVKQSNLKAVCSVCRCLGDQLTVRDFIGS